ncbi:hypothetical protein [Kosakonia sp. MUSA4]|uniref:hypothetical protein n=1 Tax=Kosakonia sp. MUSA4 TaxID=2067958 RepID=UPI00159ADAF5|nr:hypothetical protein [Kosakonia sp. MUSA4]QJT78893.1 hypothetical protein C0557_01765 [Kosakonia sp. MUSA4]
MLMMLKEVLSIPVISSIILAILAAISKKYTHFSRRDFFSRSPDEQVKAIKWLRQETDQTLDPLAKAEQQFRLQSFGLHRDRDLSCKLIAFHSSQPQSYIPALKSILRWPGLYDVDNGKITPHRHQYWAIPGMMLYLLLVMGTEIVKNYSKNDSTQFIITLIISFVAFTMWCWLAYCSLSIYTMSKRLNEYNPLLSAHKSYRDDFSSILNDEHS